MHRIVLPALCALGFGSASILAAQSTLSSPPQVGSAGATTNSGLNALRALVADNARRMTALNYMSTHPLFVSPHAVPGPWVPYLPSKSLAMVPSQAQRPECPMPVSTPASTNDSMRVSRASAMTSERMPVTAPPCVNPLGPKR
jgi:hypothetical protein